MKCYVDLSAVVRSALLLLAFSPHRPDSLSLDLAPVAAFPYCRRGSGRGSGIGVGDGYFARARFAKGLIIQRGTLRQYSR